MNRLPSEKEGWEASSDAERQSVAFRKYSEQPYRRAKEMEKNNRALCLVAQRLRGTSASRTQQFQTDESLIISHQ